MAMSPWSEAACKRPEIIYVSSINVIIFPLELPKDLYDEVKRTAQDTGLSMADAARQAMKRGLPQVREALGTAGRISNVDALPRTTLDALYADRKDDLPQIRKLIAAQPKDAD